MHRTIEDAIYLTNIKLYYNADEMDNHLNGEEIE